MKDKSGLSNQEISDRSEVPLPTVKRIMAGQTRDPGYATVIAMVKAMGGTLDDVQEIVSDDKENGAGQSNNTKEIDRLCSVYEKNIADKNRLIKALMVILISMTAIFVLLLIWDLCNPNIGFFRTRAETYNTDYVAEILKSTFKGKLL